VRVIRSIAIFKLGLWTGMMLAAAFAKRAIPSSGDEESDELSLAAILSGIDLKAARGPSGAVRCSPGTAASRSI
jgi:hypothetical protein